MHITTTRSAVLGRFTAAADLTCTTERDGQQFAIDVESIRRAECPDCAQVLRFSGDVFACGTEGHEGLAPDDVYLEYYEAATIGDDGSLLVADYYETEAN